MRDNAAPGHSAACVRPGAWTWSATEAADGGPDAGDYRHAVRIGARWLLLPADCPAEVRTTLQCTRLPFTRAFCLGLGSFRGDPVPVYDPNALLAPGTAGSGGYFLVVGRRGAAAALRIDEIAGVLVPPGSHRESLVPWPDFPAELACSAVAVGSAIYLETDLDALLAALAERASLLGTGTTHSRDEP